MNPARFLDPESASSLQYGLCLFNLFLVEEQEMDEMSNGLKWDSAFEKRPYKEPRVALDQQ